MTIPDDAKTITLVYCGQVETTTGSLVHAYEEVSDKIRTKLAGERHLFKKPLLKYQGQAGAMVEVKEWVKDGKEMVGDFKHKGQWHDRDWVTAQQVRHDALKLSRSTKRGRYKKSIETHLSQLQTIYRLATPTQKRHIIALIIEFLTRRP